MNYKTKLEKNKIFIEGEYMEENYKTIQLEQAYLYHILSPLLQLQGIQERNRDGITKEYVDKEVLADKIIEIINEHGKISVEQLEKEIKEQEVDEDETEPT